MTLRIDGNSDGFKALPDKVKKNEAKDDVLAKLLRKGELHPKIDVKNLQPVPMPMDTTKQQPKDNMPLDIDVNNLKPKKLTPEEIEKLELL